jgi:hypothetical protein
MYLTKFLGRSYLGYLQAPSLIKPLIANSCPFYPGRCSSIGRAPTKVFYFLLFRAGRESLSTANGEVASSSLATGRPFPSVCSSVGEQEPLSKSIPFSVRDVDIRLPHALGRWFEPSHTGLFSGRQIRPGPVTASNVENTPAW